MSEVRRIIGLGEVLWDVFPDRRCLGGAPGNVAYHATALGDRGAVLTRIGADALGDEAVAILSRRGVDVSAVQRDPAHPTGTVQVRIQGAEVGFEIDAHAAWAHPHWTRDWEQRVAEADAICFGTLLCAQPDGRVVVERAAEAASAEALRLLDLNLRPPFDTEPAIETALACANAVKLSEEEALRLAARAGVAKAKVDSIDALAAHLMEHRGMRAIAVTYGARGSALYTPAGCDRQPGVPLGPGLRADPVGAGDAFTAALAHHLVRHHEPARANLAANRYGAFVAGRAGAMPEVPDELRRDVTA
ncbi:PfkB family carbohydrate kinase [Haliangium sp.]|uniref:PfkB family carbohydrate kinase n=1 Tax=Haliangium sp. TaxID=2663208 RepID=UPI003D0A9D3D